MNEGGPFLDLSGHIALVGELLEPIEHRFRQAQRDRLRGRLQLREYRALAGAPIDVIGRIVSRPELPFRVLILEFWQPLFHNDEYERRIAHPKT